MANERYTENLVLETMGVTLGKNDFGYVFPQGETGNFDEIEKNLITIIQLYLTKHAEA